MILSCANCASTLATIITVFVASGGYLFIPWRKLCRFSKRNSQGHSL